VSGGESHSAGSNSRCLLRVNCVAFRYGLTAADVCFAPGATKIMRRHEMPRWAPGSRHRSLFKDLFGAIEQQHRHSDAERLNGVSATRLRWRVSPADVEAGGSLGLVRGNLYWIIVALQKDSGARRQLRLSYARRLALPPR